MIAIARAEDHKEMWGLLVNKCDTQESKHSRFALAVLDVVQHECVEWCVSKDVAAHSQAAWQTKLL